MKDQTVSSPIGALLVKAGFISEQQLNRALRVQRLLEEPRQLGDVLCELGYIKRKDLNDAIVKHGAHLRLGEMLVEQGIITRETLERALTLQQANKMRLGEALISLGAINERTLLRNIAHQTRLPYIEPSFPLIDPMLLQGVSPEYLAQRVFVPFSRDEEGITLVVIADLGSPAREAAMEMYHNRVTFALGPVDAIQSAVADFARYRNRDDFLPSSGHDAGDVVVKMVDHIISQAIEERASDVHIEPLSDKVRIRYRIDGILVYKTDLPLSLLPKLISRIKIMAEGNITEHQCHQGGRILYAYKDREIDLRLSIYVTVHGESAVMRILNKELALVSLDELGMSPHTLRRYREDVLDLPTGVVLITGPTGSGKTTTLYSSIDYCNDITKKIITAEDPVEFTIEGIVQCSIAEKVGRTFDATLREMVRQDPDIIVMGEIRDKITANVAIQAALTGHKVYSTFHTEDTIGGLLRLIDMEIETFLISSTVISVLAQRLLRRICAHCASAHIPSSLEIQAMGLDVAEARQYEYRRGSGCVHCSYTGYRGRIGVYELLVLNESVKEAILQKKTAHEIRRISTETTGLVSMREDAVAKVIHGHTTFEEALKHTPRTFFMRSIKQIINMSQ